MKPIILSLLVLLSVFASGQNNQTITYTNLVDGYKFEYPSEWDSASFAQIMKENEMDFGAVIKPTFNNNRTGGWFTLERSDSYGADLMIIGRETAASLERVYPDAKILESKQKISANKIAYHSLITEITESGSTRVTNKIQILRGDHIYSFAFTCPKRGYEKLNWYFGTVINSFTFVNP